MLADENAKLIIHKSFISVRHVLPVDNVSRT